LIALAPLDAELHRLQPLFPHLYLTLSRVLDGRDHERNARALWLRSRFQIPIVATNDVHYHRPGRQRLQDALTGHPRGHAAAKARA